MRKSIAAAVIAASAATAGCHVGSNSDAGPTVSRTFSVGSFQRIEVAGPYAVDVRTGTAQSISATGSQNLLDHTSVEVNGDKLVIRPEGQHSWFSFGWHSRGKAHFTVTVPQLREAAIAGSGGIGVDHVQGDNFEGSVAGSGDLQLGTIAVESLKLSIAGSGGIKAGSGKAQSGRYSISGSGDVDAGSVATQQAKVSISGSGSIRANASATADVSIAGSGDVDISGGAKCSVSKAGSGSVRCS